MDENIALFTFKIRNPEAAHRWAMCMGAARHLINGWQSLGISSWLSGDTAEHVYYFDDIEHFMQSHESLELFTDYVDKCLVFENDKHAFKCFDESAAWLCEHDIPERHCLLELIVEMVLARRTSFEEAEWDSLLYDFLASFGMSMEESVGFISEVEAKKELRNLK